MAFYYNLPTDDITSSATITAHFGTVNADYPLTNLHNDNLAMPVKFTAATSNVRICIKFDYASSQAMRAFFAFHLNHTSSLDHFTWISDTSSDFNTPGTRASFTVTYSGLASDNYSIDPYVATGLAAATARRYWYLDIETLATFNTPAIGRVWTSLTLRTLAGNFRYDDHAYTRAHAGIVHQTSLGANLNYPRGTRDETLSGTMRVTSADYALLKTLFDVAGETRAFPIVPDSVGTPIVSTAAEAFLVRFAPGSSFAPRFTPNAGPGLMDIQLSFAVVARGLTL